MSPVTQMPRAQQPRFLGCSRQTDPPPKHPASLLSPASTLVPWQRVLHGPQMPLGEDCIWSLPFHCPLAWKLESGSDMEPLEKLVHQGG